MADENLSALQDQIKELREAMAGLTKDTQDADLAQKKFKQTMGDAAKSFGGFAKGMAGGRSSFEDFNGIVDMAGTATGKLSKSILKGAADVTEKVPILGGALKFAADSAEGFAKAVATSTKFLVSQLDVTYKAFEEFGEIGALGAKGMTSLKEQSIASGMSLEGFQKTVIANSKALASFEGTTYDGARRFSDIVGAIATTQVGDQLRAIGIGADKIGEAAAAFITRETRLGRDRLRTDQLATESIVKYTKELDELSKLTGLNKNEIQKQQDAALSEARFRAKVDELRASGQIEAADTLLNFQTVAAKMGPTFAQGVRDLASGNVTTEAAEQLVRSTGGVGQQIMRDLEAGLIGPVEAAKRFQGALSANEQAARDNAKAMGDEAKVFLPYAERSDIARMKLLESGEVVRDTQKKQITETDDLTKTTVSAKKAMETFSRVMQEIAFNALPLAANAIYATARGLVTFAEAAGVKLPEDMKKAIQAGVNQSTGGAVVGRPTTAPRMGTTPGAGGTVVGGAGGEGDAGAIMDAAGGGTLQLNDVINFGTGSGSLDNFKGLSPDVQAALVQAATTYKQQTGNKLTLNSAYRDPSKQAQLYAEYVARGMTGTPVAPPGNSLHESGRAVDIQEYRDAKAIAALVGAGFRQNGVAGDEMHFQMNNGGILSGPVSGYRPNLTMHGTEAIIPLPDGRSVPVSGTMDSTILAAQLEKLDQIVNVMQSQLNVSNKLLSYQS